MSRQKNIKSNPYKVPEGYFDSLAENIMGRIESNNKNTRPFVRSIISSRSFKLAAASLLILVSIGQQWFK